MITEYIDLPERFDLIEYINHEIEKKDFPDKIKGCVDINPDMIPNGVLNTLEKLGYNREITRAWIHFMDPGSDHASGHIHEHDTAVVYLQTYEGSGDLKFNDSNEILHPENDMLAIVPALENHSMTTNESPFRRLAMAFPISK